MPSDSSSREPNGEKSGLESLEDQLYSRTPPPLRRSEGSLSEERRVRIAPSWTEEEERKASGLFSFFSAAMSWLVKLFIASVLFFLLAGMVALYGFWRGGNTVSPQNISIAVLGPVSAPAGEELPFEITIGNYNELELSSLELLVEYPRGTRKPGDVSAELPRHREALETLPAGGTVSRRLSIIPFGQEGEKKKILVTVEYRQKDSNAIFSRAAEYEFQINAAPVSVVASAPKEVSSGQSFEITFDITSNSSSVIKNLTVSADYPLGFTFSGSSPDPSFSKNVWSFGDVRAQGKRSVTVTGTIVAPEETERTFRFSLGTAHPRDEKQLGVVFLTESVTVTVKKPFVALDLLVNGKGGDIFIARSNQTLRADIVWENSLDEKITDVVITAKLDGAIYDTASVGGGTGFYESSSATLRWDKRAEPRLGVVGPGEGGTQSFSFSLRPVATDPSYKNPAMMIHVFAQGKRLDEQGLVQDVVSSFTKEVKIASSLGFISRLVYSGGPFVNSGPLPPKAGAETTYTVVWSLSNSSNALANVEVRAVLPSYVRWLDRVSPASEQIEYNPLGGEVVWKVGEMKSGVGFGAAPREAAFQVSLLPSASQAGSAAVVIGEARGSGDDRFAKTAVQSQTRAPLSTDSLAETGAGNGMIVK